MCRFSIRFSCNELSAIDTVEGSIWFCLSMFLVFTPCDLHNLRLQAHSSLPILSFLQKKTQANRAFTTSQLRFSIALEMIKWRQQKSGWSQRNTKPRHLKVFGGNKIEAAWRKSLPENVNPSKLLLPSIRLGAYGRKRNLWSLKYTRHMCRIVFHIFHPVICRCPHFILILKQIIGPHFKLSALRLGQLCWPFPLKFQFNENCSPSFFLCNPGVLFNLESAIS